MSMFKFLKTKYKENQQRREGYNNYANYSEKDYDSLAPAVRRGIEKRKDDIAKVEAENRKYKEKIDYENKRNRLRKRKDEYRRQKSANNPFRLKNPPPSMFGNIGFNTGNRRF